MARPLFKPGRKSQWGLGAASKKQQIFDLIQGGITDTGKLMRLTGAARDYVMRIRAEFQAEDKVLPPSIEELSEKALTEKYRKRFAENNPKIAELYKRILFQTHRLEAQRAMHIETFGLPDDLALRKLREIRILKAALSQIISPELKKQIEKQVERKLLE